jgi:hypothetical protein
LRYTQEWVFGVWKAATQVEFKGITREAGLGNPLVTGVVYDPGIALSRRESLKYLMRFN